VVSAIWVVLKSQGGHVFSFRVELERLSLPHIGFGPLESDAGQVSQHFVCLDARDVFFYELVTLALFPFANVRRFLDVLAIDSVESKLVSVIVHIDAVIFAFPHVCCLRVLCLFGMLLIRQYRYVAPS
jgi:hypothetical protein